MDFIIKITALGIISQWLSTISVWISGLPLFRLPDPMLNRSVPPSRCYWLLNHIKPSIQLFPEVIWCPQGSIPGRCPKYPLFRNTFNYVMGYVV